MKNMPDFLFLSGIFFLFRVFWKISPKIRHIFCKKTGGIVSVGCFKNLFLIRRRPAYDY